jgi:hypothetical protein
VKAEPLVLSTGASNQRIILESRRCKVIVYISYFKRKKAQVARACGFHLAMRALNFKEQVDISNCNE